MLLKFADKCTDGFYNLTDMNGAEGLIFSPFMVTAAFVLVMAAFVLKACHCFIYFRVP